MAAVRCRYDDASQAPGVRVRVRVRVRVSQAPGSDGSDGATPSRLSPVGSVVNLVQVRAYTGDTQTHTHTHIHTHTNTYSHSHTLSLLSCLSSCQPYTHTYTYISTHARTHARTHACTHARTGRARTRCTLETLLWVRPLKLCRCVGVCVRARVCVCVRACACVDTECADTRHAHTAPTPPTPLLHFTPGYPRHGFL